MPEAHLHPQLQRSVFKRLLAGGDAAQALIVTSHSPTLAAVTPLRSIIPLKTRDQSTHAFSLADLPVTPDELDDLETYLDATRAEMLFARGAIYAEGDAEEALVPVFSSAIGHVLDEHHSVQCGWHEFRTIRQARRSSGHALCGNHDWDPLDGTKNRPSARNVHWTSGMTY